MLALYFGRLRHLSFEAGQRIIGELRRLPGAVQEALACDAQVRQVAAKYQNASNFLYLGLLLEQVTGRPYRYLVADLAGVHG